MIGLAVGAIAWIMSTAAGPSAEPLAQAAQPTCLRSPSASTSTQAAASSTNPVPELGGVLVLVVRDEGQAAGVQAMVAAEARLRTLANEPLRSVAVVASPNDDVYRGLLDDANLLSSGRGSSLTVIDLR
jgi:hypothetical protein